MLPQVGPWKIGDWCLLELVLKIRDIGVSLSWCSKEEKLVSSKIVACK
jgi:hypothetical protein